MGFNLFTASSHHSELKQCIMQHQVVDFRLVDRLFFIAKQIAKFLILKRQSRSLFMIKWQQKIKRDWIQNLKYAYEK